TSVSPSPVRQPPPNVLFSECPNPSPSVYVGSNGHDYLGLGDPEGQVGSQWFSQVKAPASGQGTLAFIQVVNLTQRRVMSAGGQVTLSDISSSAVRPLVDAKENAAVPYYLERTAPI